MSKIRTIFIGTPNFAVPSLQKLINHGRFELQAVISQPDKKVGRKQTYVLPPVKSLALANKIPVFQPEKIISIIGKVRKMFPDIIVVVAYAQLLPKDILDIPRYGCMNVHGSLLPRYRGAACIQSAILNGDKETGVTFFKMTEKLDSGPIIAQKPISISNTDTGGSLYEKLSILSAESLVSVLTEYIDSKIIPREQDERLASFVKSIKKTDGQISWQQPADSVERFIRAMQPWPGAFSNLEGNRKRIIKIMSVGHKAIRDEGDHKPGEIFIHKGDLAVRCADDALIINKLQPEGKNKISGQQFINGYKNYIGSILI